MIIEASFDPVTMEEVRAICTLMKQERITDLYIQASAEGIAERKVRTKMLKLAFGTYRHIHVVEGKQSDRRLEGYADGEKKARSGYFRLVPASVCHYLLENGMYLQQIVEAQCSPKRAVHSKGVADTCVILARAHHLDEKLAERMGYLHDVTKSMSDEEGREILRRWSPSDLSLNPKIWHSRTAVIWLKQNMGLYDPRILLPIWNHTLGNGKSDYDRILYIADKIEPNRNYDTTYHLSLARKDLKKAVELVRKEGEEYRRKGN